MKPHQPRAAPITSSTLSSSKGLTIKFFAPLRRASVTLSFVPAETFFPEANGVLHAHHLFIIALNDGMLNIDRDGMMEALKAENIATGVHFRSLHIQLLSGDGRPVLGGFGRLPDSS